MESNKKKRSTVAPSVIPKRQGVGREPLKSSSSNDGGPRAGRSSTSVVRKKGGSARDNTQHLLAPLIRSGKLSSKLAQGASKRVLVEAVGYCTIEPVIAPAPDPDIPWTQVWQDFSDLGFPSRDGANEVEVQSIWWDVLQPSIIGFEDLCTAVSFSLPVTYLAHDEDPAAVGLQTTIVTPSSTPKWVRIGSVDVSELAAAGYSLVTVDQSLIGNIGCFIPDDGTDYEAAPPHFVGRYTIRYYAQIGLSVNTKTYLTHVATSESVSVPGDLVDDVVWQRFL